MFVVASRSLNVLYDFRYLVVLLSITYAFYRLISTIIWTKGIRKRYHGIPGLPRHWLLGNLANMGERLSPSLNRHPDYGFEEIWNECGQPPVFFVDLAPIERAMIIVADPTIAEYFTQPSSEFRYSLPKSDTVQTISRLIGRESMILAEGETWRNLRKRFSKGFAPAHLHTLNPLIIAKTKIFVDKLKAAARSGDSFELKTYSQDLTTDIITQLTVEKDFESQSIPEGQGPKGPLGVLNAARVLSTLVAKIGQGADLVGWLNVVRPIKYWFYEQVYDRALYSVLDEKLKADKADEKRSSVASGKAIVQLALAGADPSPALMYNTVSQIKSFIFAGQDTTATTIQWCAYNLSKAKHNSRHAEVLQRLKAEHDQVFGADDAFSAIEILSNPANNQHLDELLGAKIPYTTAFIKEVLRLHPPAGTARIIPDESTETPPVFMEVPAWKNENDGSTVESKRVQVNGLRMYNCQWLIHRNKRIIGEDAHEFRPERWLDEKFMSEMPAGWWRPFERGPRNCIGQELALMEAKAVLCCVARGIDFIKDGNDGLEGRREIWNVNNVTSVPADGMRMKVKLTK